MVGKQQKIEEGDRFRFKSFVAELLIAKLDNGMELEDYPTALENFFAYIVKSSLKERISFVDYYSKSALPNKKMGEIEIFDPVNPKQRTRRIHLLHNVTICGAGLTMR